MQRSFRVQDVSWKLVLFIGAGLTFWLLQRTVRMGAAFSWDTSLVASLSTWRHPVFDTVFALITVTAGLLIVIPIVLVIGWLWRQRRHVQAVTVLVSTAGMGLVTRLLKQLYARPRPDVDLVWTLFPEDTFSFPSGHTTAAIAFYGLLTIYLWRADRRPLAALSGFWVLLVGVSRIYLGAHYPSDVLASLAMGIMWLILLIVVVETLRRFGIVQRQPSPASD